MKQALATSLNGVDGGADIFGGYAIQFVISQHVDRCRGQRGNGGDGVHDFMGEDADEILPRFHLLFFERPTDVIQGHEGMLAITHTENGGVEGQLDRLSFGFESHQLLVARTEGAQSRCQGRTHTIQIIYVAQAWHTQQTFGGVVDEGHIT